MEPRATATPSALSLQAVRKSYGATVALDEMTLDVQQGEFVTLLGPSGSGKSTTLMVVAGFIPPTSGEVFIFKKPMSGVPPERRNVGMVFQNYALFPHMSVSGNLGFPLRMRKRDRPSIEQSVGAMLDLLKLPGFEGRRPHELSGGQQQRVALGRALIFSPRIVLMDEPLGALDRALRDELQHEIRRVVKDTGATTIYVTHDQGEALALSDRIAVLRHGRLEQVGTPSEIYRQPRNRFVATFVGGATVAAGTVIAQRDDGAGPLIELAGADGLRVAATSARSHQHGESVTAVIRPEDVRLVPSDGSNSVVVDEVFQGDVVRREVRAGTLSVVSQDPSQRELLGVGRSVDVTIEGVWILPDGGG